MELAEQGSGSNRVLRSGDVTTQTLTRRPIVDGRFVVDPSVVRRVERIKLSMLDHGCNTLFS
jgi:hypothetical protein